MGSPAKWRPRVLPCCSSSDQATAYQWSGCAPTRRRSKAFGEFAGRKFTRFELSSCTGAPGPHSKSLSLALFVQKGLQGVRATDQLPLNKDLGDLGGARCGPH